MAIGGSPTGAPRAKDGSRGAAGRYVFMAEVARGYLGALWVARDAADSSALGIVHVRHVTPLVAASARAAILEGARWAMAGADSPSFEILESRNAVDLITPFIEGEPLRSLLRSAAVKHAAVEPEVLLGFTQEWVRELAALHERTRSGKTPHAFGGVHPDSVIIDLKGGVHLVDVGSGAAASAREPWRSDPQRVGYFAPEQLESRGVVDARTDVFAIGIVLWEALANRRLFPGNDAKTARDRVQKAPIARLDATRPSATPGVSTAIADLVARCLERDPAARFQTMEELQQALSEIQTATLTRIGGWVASLADSAIGKRRQALERAPNASGTRESVPPPSGGARPSFAAPKPSDSRPPSPVKNAEDGRPSTLPRPPLAAAPAPRAPTPAKPAATPQPPAARTSVPPRPGAATPPPPPARAAAAGTDGAAVEERSSVPPPPSMRAPAEARSSMPPPPPSARAASHAAGTEPKSSPAAAAATATPMPPSRRSVPPRPRSATTEDAARAEPAATPAEPARATTPEPAPVAAARPEATPNAPEADAPRPPADSAEAIEPIEDDEPPDSSDIEEDNDDETEAAAEPAAEGAEAASPADDTSSGEEDDHSASIPPVSKKPPPLPHDELGSPAHTSTFASLTAPGPATKNPLIRLALAAFIVAIIASAWILIRAKPKVRTVTVEKPDRVAHTVERPVEAPPVRVETPPVHIEEKLSAVPKSGATPSAEPAPPPEATAAAASAPPPKTETPVVHKARTAPAEARPPAGAQVKQNGFKPGGI